MSWLRSNYSSDVPVQTFAAGGGADGARKIRAIRKRLGMSQTVFATALNVSPATVRAWEQGARIPEGPSRRLLEIADRHPHLLLENLS